MGRSTAGAILSIALGQRASILDGNVKRVSGPIPPRGGLAGQIGGTPELWGIAEQYTPAERCADYYAGHDGPGRHTVHSQCTGLRRLPLRDDCEARLHGDQTQYPGKKPQSTAGEKDMLPHSAHRPAISGWKNDQRVASGADLWCFPEIDQPTISNPHCSTCGACTAMTSRQVNRSAIPSVTTIWISRPWYRAWQDPDAVMEATGQLWYNLRQPPQIGLAAPVAELDQNWGGQPPSLRHGVTLCPAQCFARSTRRKWKGWTAPLPGPKGQDIFDNVSKQAWQDWQAHQTMLINEKHLSLVTRSAEIPAGGDGQVLRRGGLRSRLRGTYRPQNKPEGP